MNLRTKLKLADFAQGLLQTQNEIIDIVTPLESHSIPPILFQKICELDMLMHEVRGRISNLTDNKD